MVSWWRMTNHLFLNLNSDLKLGLLVLYSTICFSCSVIVEALKVDSLQRLCSSLEPILRKVVRWITCHWCLLAQLLIANSSGSPGFLFLFLFWFSPSSFLDWQMFTLWRKNVHVIIAGLYMISLLFRLVSYCCPLHSPQKKEEKTLEALSSVPLFDWAVSPGLHGMFTCFNAEKL